MKKIINEWRNFTVLSEGRSLPQILHTLMGGRESIQTVGILTAENPRGEQAPAELNKEANDNLMSDLRDMNLGFRRLRGSFGNKEESFMVPNITREEAVKMGGKYDQVSVIWGSKQDDGMVFEYIESGITKQKRNVILTGADIQSRGDYYSQEPKGPEAEAGKFLVPFFDDEYEMLDEQEELDERSETEKVYAEINKRVGELLKENKTGKFRWEQRGMIKQLKKSLVSPKKILS